MKEQEINEASLTAKQGFANGGAVSQMDENGNAGGVMAYSDASGGDLATHEADITLHKTAAEQSKLDHLADDADATYAAKSAVDDCTPIVFRATYDVVDGVNKYTLDAGQDSKYREYFEQNKTNLVELICIPNDSGQSVIKCALDRKRIIGNTYRMNFNSINWSNIEQFELIVTMIAPTDWSHLTLSCRSLPLEASEYKCTNYAPLESFDMNNWIESGGISVIINADMVGTNIPADFTEFYGFVLKNKGGKNIKGCCTQVVTDKVLKKTMMRHSFPKSSLVIEWTPWRHIDGDSESEVIRFTATYDVVDGVNKYTLVSGQENKYIEYFEQNKTNPVELICIPNDSGQPVIKCTLDKTQIWGGQHNMYFHSINRNNVEKLSIDGTKVLSGAWMGVRLSCDRLPLEASEYKYAYYSPMESFDMNDWIDSGGVSAFTSPATDSDPGLIGANIPTGFTEFYGFILKNDGYGTPRSRCCTQVVTDRVLKKTMMRNAFPIPKGEIEWTPWKQIDAVVPEVYVVADYPADLSNYPDGSIFIKEQI